MTKSNFRNLEIYIHIPFCVRKCSYCDFLSFPCDREGQRAYIEALFAEIEGKAEKYREYRVTSVFIGGGTPSILPGEWIEELLERIRNCFRVGSDINNTAESVCQKEPENTWKYTQPEITIEVNPGTVDAKKLAAYYRAGVNRLSIGLQSAEDEELKMLGRIHNYEAFLDTYQAAREAGFANINVDIMSALPGQTLDSYRRTLGKVLSLTPAPEHISAYSLIVEEGTPFARWDEEGILDLPDEDCERAMYEETKRILGEAGLYRYEISNYARPGYECRHNCGYWERVDYVGFGIGAASLVANTRFNNGSDLQKYLTDPLGCSENMQVLSKEEQMEETMFLGLRMTRGVGLAAFAETYGQTMEQVYGPVIQKNISDGLLEYRMLSEGMGKCAEVYEARYLALTEKGLDVSNYVMADFIM
ncbi:MAG: radical SAM family heme chaperone HemW [Lachnospiraceae bacterium]|nr:radical SAM family heme chaperone HemW [Lachnospiraceae bacterium]